MRHILYNKSRLFLQLFDDLLSENSGLKIPQIFVGSLCGVRSKE